jgi:hypothetical protein
MDPYTHMRQVVEVPVAAELLAGWRRLANEPRGDAKSTNSRSKERVK